MKKLMFGFAMAAAFAAVADIESTNVVGFNNGTSGAANNFVTLPFGDVGFNTTDLQNLKISDGGQGNIGWGEEIFQIWEGVPTIVEGAYFFLYDPSADPTGTATDYYWGDEGCNKAPAFSIAPGQGVVVNCAAGLSVGTAGEVPDTEVSFTTGSGNNFTGNPYPASIDLSDFVISDGGQGNIGWGEEIFQIWEGVPTIVEGSYFFLYDPSADPTGTATDYYWGDEGCSKAPAYAINIGQGVVINCAAGLKVTIKKPYALAE